MIVAPKGYKYWYNEGDGPPKIRDDAPEWAKKEFKRYMKLFEQKPDKNGNITDY